MCNDLCQFVAHCEALSKLLKSRLSVGSTVRSFILARLGGELLLLDYRPTCYFWRNMHTQKKVLTVIILLHTSLQDLQRSVRREPSPWQEEEEEPVVG